MALFNNNHPTASCGQAALAFNILLQGRNAFERSKAVARPTRDAIAAAMLHEAMNGYSIVFSGIFLLSSLPKIFQQVLILGIGNSLRSIALLVSVMLRWRGTVAVKLVLLGFSADGTML